MRSDAVILGRPDPDPTFPKRIRESRSGKNGTGSATLIFTLKSCVTRFDPTKFKLIYYFK